MVAEPPMMATRRAKESISVYHTQKYPRPACQAARSQRCASILGSWTLGASGSAQRFAATCRRGSVRGLDPSDWGQRRAAGGGVGRSGPVRGDRVESAKDAAKVGRGRWLWRLGLSWHSVGGFAVAVRRAQGRAWDALQDR